ncbi:hypothetical protein B0A50_04075 [Salinomyces thailandicus]|uniref:FHA domain-containing protein n=1 Tax=Salinomyces thailandicus TaxID=706561 RepID=A0A4V5N685_9PEZI|nr:hypothetical protein B0A50_04075 [Salinomyces thailandica]
MAEGIDATKDQATNEKQTIALDAMTPREKTETDDETANVTTQTMTTTRTDPTAVTVTDKTTPQAETTADANTTSVPTHETAHATSPPRKTRAPLPSQADLFPGSTTSNPNSQPDSANSGPPKQKPNYAPTGLLAKEANTITGTTTVLKYHEPPEARKPPPTQQWRLYVFKQKDLLETLHLYTRSIWLVGRDESITDLYLPHPSISKQHAVIQFRFVSVRDEFGEGKGRVRPYVMDLESANGTSLNGERVEATRFVELRDGDVLGFGESEREFVVMLPPEGSA